MSIVALIGLVIQVLVWIIFIDVILTWIPSVSRSHPIVLTLRSITTPIYEPIRKLIPPEKTGYIDVSPIIAILGLQIIGAILQRILIGL